jgi:hypothetical protein
MLPIFYDYLSVLDYFSMSTAEQFYLSMGRVLHFIRLMELVKIVPVSSHTVQYYSKIDLTANII